MCFSDVVCSLHYFKLLSPSGIGIRRSNGIQQFCTVGTQLVTTFPNMFQNACFHKYPQVVCEGRFAQFRHFLELVESTRTS